jgi:hypothetical protein
MAKYNLNEIIHHNNKTYKITEIRNIMNKDCAVCYFLYKNEWKPVINWNIKFRLAEIYNTL